jgi:sulfate adenylyltransferase (ADP) / ATP adenylyltransferase
LQTPHFEPPGDANAGAGDDHEKKKHTDVFSSPYNPNLYVGELRDEEEGREYVVLVSILLYMWSSSVAMLFRPQD